MKKLLLLFVAILGIVACEKYDDSELVAQLDAQATKIDALQSQIDTLTAALAESTNELQSQINANSGNITANAEAINDANDAIASNLTLIGQVSTTLTSELSLLYSEIEATELELVAELTDAVNNLESLNAESVGLLQTEIATAYQAALAADSVFDAGDILSQLEELDTAVASNTAGINANSDAIVALTSRLDVVDIKLADIRQDDANQNTELRNLSDALNKVFIDLKALILNANTDHAALQLRVEALEQGVDALEALTDNAIVDYRLDSQVLVLIDADGVELEIDLNKFVTQFDFDTDLLPAIESKIADAIQPTEIEYSVTATGTFIYSLSNPQEKSIRITYAESVTSEHEILAETTVSSITETAFDFSSYGTGSIEIYVDGERRPEPLVSITLGEVSSGTYSAARRLRVRVGNVD